MLSTKLHPQDQFDHHIVSDQTTEKGKKKKPTPPQQQKTSERMGVFYFAASLFSVNNSNQQEFPLVLLCWHILTIPGACQPLLVGALCT